MAPISRAMIAISVAGSRSPPRVAAAAARAGERDAATLIAIMAREIGATAQAGLDYAAVVDDETFEEVRTLERPARALVAAGFGEVRLIDNLLLPT